MKVMEVKMDNAAFSAAFVLSFPNATEFVKKNENEFFLHKELKERRAMLRDVYKVAKTMEGELMLNQ